MEQDSLEPRNARLKNMDEVEREGEARADSLNKKLKDFKNGKMPDTEELEEMPEKSEAERLSDFIEIVVRLPKP